MPQSDPYQLGWRLTEGGRIVDARDELQDPSTDIENVNAAYRIERDRGERLRAALQEFVDHEKADPMHLFDLSRLRRIGRADAALHWDPFDDQA